MSEMTTAVPAPRPMRWLTAAQTFALLVGLFLAVRAITTLAGGASFGFPGDGWRAAFQLLVAGALGLALVRHEWSRRIVLAVCGAYVVLTVLGAGSDSVLGVIPVDARDRIVHPLIAVLAAVALVIPRLREGRPSAG
jgi:hypothetical protein